jgi:hypothetical protein
VTEVVVDETVVVAGTVVVVDVVVVVVVRLTVTPPGPTPPGPVGALFSQAIIKDAIARTGNSSLRMRPVPLARSGETADPR